MQVLQAVDETEMTHAERLEKLANAANKAADALERVGAALRDLHGDFGAIHIAVVGDVADFEIKPN